jgi:hypothetical protein
LLSLFVVLAYVGVATVVAGPPLTLRVVAFLVLPMLCIWFPDVMGSFTGGRVTRRSPASFVSFFGWVILFLPMIVGILLWIQGVPLDR